MPSDVTGLCNGSVAANIIRIKWVTRGYQKKVRDLEGIWILRIWD